MDDIIAKNESIKEFKEDFLKNINKVDYKRYDKICYVDNFFFDRKIPYIQEKFFEILIEITTNILKSYIQELEYYVNIKPTTIQMSSDSEILFNEKDELNKQYLKLHIHYKEYHQLYLQSKLNSNNEIKEYFYELFESLEKFNQYSIKLQEKLITNLKEKLIDINENKIKNYESPIYH